MNLQQQFWQRFLELAQETLKKAVFDFYVGDAQLVSLTNQTVTIFLDKPFKRDFWEKYCEDFLLATSFELFNDTIQIQYILSEHQSSLTTPYNDTQPNDNKQLEQVAVTEVPQFHSDIRPQYTFENFVQGENNRYALAAAITVADTPGRMYNPLFIHGGPGLGKTHLLNAIGNSVLKDNPRARVKYISTETFTNELIKALHLSDKSNRLSAMDKFRNLYRNVDLLLVDDVQSLRNKPVVQEEFFNTFEELFKENKQIVLTSDRNPDTLDNLETRIISRFAWGNVVEVTPPDFDTRVAILRSKCTVYPHHFPNETLSYLAGQFDSHVRDLEGALKDISLLAQVRKLTEITVEAAAEALQARIQQQPSHKVIAIETIQAATGKYYGISMAELKGAKRVKHIAHARQVAMYLVREMTDNSLPKIGREFGNRDHTTVLHAHNKIASMIADDSQLEIEITAIKNTIR